MTTDASIKEQDTPGVATNTSVSISLLSHVSAGTLKLLTKETRSGRVRPTEGSLLTNLFSKNTDWQSAPLCCYAAIKHSVSHVNPWEAAFHPLALPKMVMNPEEIFISHCFTVIGHRSNHGHVNLITLGLIQGQVWRHERSAWRQTLRCCWDEQAGAVRVKSTKKRRKRLLLYDVWNGGRRERGNT